MEAHVITEKCCRSFSEAAMATAQVGTTLDTITETTWIFDYDSLPDESPSISWSFHPFVWSWANCFQLLAAVLGIMGNLPVVILLPKTPYISKSTNILICAMSAGDLLTSIFMIPLPIASSIPNTVMGQLYCRVIHPSMLLWLFVTVSTYILVGISIERCIAVVNPIFFRTRIERVHILAYIAFVCVFSIFACSFILLVDVDDGRCVIQFAKQGGSTIVGYYLFCLRIIVPVLIMGITQIAIAVYLQRQSGKFTSSIGKDLPSNNSTSTGSSTSTYHVKARDNVLKMVLIVILIYVICWTPGLLALFLFMQGFLSPTFLHSPFYTALSILAFFNCCLNPFVYVIRHENFRAALLRSLGCRY